jgi:CRP/FNR family transcriptional regulator, cyclic AMP receptor protein
MLRRNAKIELLRRVPLFSGCSKRELEQIAGIADELDFPAGKVLIREGRPGLECFVVIDGQVSVTRGGRPVEIRGGSELLGEMALLTDQPRNATVTTVTPVHALVLTSRGFRSLVQTTPSISLKVLKSVADRLQPQDQ